MSSSIDTLSSHTNDEALRGYDEHLQDKARLEAEAAARALALAQDKPTIVATNEQRTEPHEHFGFGD